MEKVRIIIADDHPLIRKAIRLLVSTSGEVEVVAEAQDGSDTIEQVTRYPADILLLDANMPGHSVTEVVTQVQEVDPTLKIVIISASGESSVFQSLVHLGICGYILKEEADEGLVPVLKSIHAGETWFSKGLLKEHSSVPFTPNPMSLTEREIDILEALGRGMSNGQISLQFNLSAQTIRNYASRIYEKLDIASRAEAVLWVAKHGLPTRPSVLAASQQMQSHAIHRV